MSEGKGSDDGISLRRRGKRTGLVSLRKQKISLVRQTLSGDKNKTTNLAWVEEIQ